MSIEQKIAEILAESKANASVVSSATTEETKELVFCDCDVSNPCPQGKIGMELRCKIWKNK